MDLNSRFVDRELRQVMGVGACFGVPWGTRPCGAIPDLQTVLSWQNGLEKHVVHGFQR